MNPFETTFQRFDTIKSRSIAVLWLLVLACIANQASAGISRLTSAGGPEGGTISALAIDPQAPATVYAGTTGYAGTGGGVFKTTDGGAHWQAVNTGLNTKTEKPMFLP